MCVTIKPCDSSLCINTLIKTLKHNFKQIELSGVILTSVTVSYGITPSTPSTIPTSTSDGISQTDIMLIVVVGGASTAVSVSLVVLCIACCYKHRHGNKGKKGKLSGRSSLSQLQRLRPTFKVYTYTCRYIL